MKQAISRGILVLMNSTSSFFRFVLGFLTFISMSFVITFAVNSYTVAQDQREQTATALQALVEQKK